MKTPNRLQALCLLNVEGLVDLQLFQILKKGLFFPTEMRNNIGEKIAHALKEITSIAFHPLLLCKLMTYLQQFPLKGRHIGTSKAHRGAFGVCEGLFWSLCVFIFLRRKYC